MVRALYTSESRVLIEDDVLPFARAATDQGRDQIPTLDGLAIQSQLQVLTSRDLALRVTKELDLANNPEFAKDASSNVVARLLGKLGIDMAATNRSSSAPPIPSRSTSQFTRSASRA